MPIVKGKNTQPYYLFRI